MFRPLRIAGLVVLIAVPAGAAQAQRITEVQLAPPFVRMVPEAQVQASATAYDSSGTPVVVRFRWTSSNINVATVSENGLVRAVAPGTALISASYEGQRGGRRRAMQVQVFSRTGPTSVTINPAPAVAPAVPPPGAPGMPGSPGIPVTPPPGAMPVSPPGTPPMVYVSPGNVDSMVKASINCNEPMLNAANPLRACYDQRPTPRVPPSAVTLATCPGLPASNGVLVMVRVTESGSVADVMPFGHQGCEQQIESAVVTARAMTFNPALREGRPVSAWVRVVLRSTEQPPKQ